MIDQEIKQAVVDLLNLSDRAEIVERIAYLAHCASLVVMIVEDNFVITSEVAEKMRAAVDVL